MLALLTDPAVWAAFLTLAALEIVLGIDNLIFLAIITERLPPAQQPLARRIGLGLALLGRLALLAALGWLIGLTKPLVEIGEFALSMRDLILLLGGLFLLAKATVEMHHMLEGAEAGAASAVATATFGGVLVQIVMLDMVFSLDSILTAIGMVEEIWIMAAAIVLAIVIMLVAAEPLSAFVNRHPTVKSLALSFLLLVGVSLVADGLHFHIPRGYLYFAIGFSASVEAFNLALMRRRAARRAALQDAG